MTEIPQKSMGDSKLYAKWIANTYTVKFDANGGEGEAIDNVEFVYDEEQRLPENTFKRNGLMFAGWNTDAEGRCRWYGDRAMVKKCYCCTV